jgi:hypothetical protein
MDPDALCLGIAGQKEGFSAAPHGSQTGLIKGVEGRFASGWRCAIMICPGAKHADQANVTYQKKLISLILGIVLAEESGKLPVIRSF